MSEADRTMSSDGTSTRKSQISSRTSIKKERNRGPAHVDVKEMIKVYGNQEWHEVNNIAKVVIGRDAVVSSEGEPINFKPIEGLEKAYFFVVEKYIEYIWLMKVIDEVMYRLIHPQKRLLLGKFIEAIAGRICELRQEMTKLSCTHLHNFTGVLQELGLTPDNIEYKIPESMLQARREPIELREKFITASLLSLSGGQEDQTIATVATLGLNQRDSIRSSASISSKESKEPGSKDSTTSLNSKDKRSTTKDSVSDRSSPKTNSSSLHAIPLGDRKRSKVTEADIQAKKKKTAAEKAMSDFLNSKRYRKWLTNPTFHEKVCLLQRQIRNYVNKKIRWQQYKNVNSFLNFDLPKENGSSEAQEQEAETFELQCKERDYEMNYSLEKLRHQYMPSSEGSFDSWALTLSLKQWVLELRDLMGKFQPYPDADAGGCGALFTNRTVAEIQEEIENLEELEKQKKAAAKAGKDKAKKKDEGKGKGKSKDKDEGFLWTMPKSTALPGLYNALHEYASYWYMKKEDTNLDQRYDLQLAKEKVRQEAEETIRQLCDTLMRDEMERLRAIDQENPPKPDKKKGKKDKGKKKGKKDPLGGRPIEMLYEEMVLSKIAVKTNNVSLDDYVGGHNFEDKQRQPYRLSTGSDLKMTLREVFGLPLCSSSIHSNLDTCNSLMLAGPNGVGKTLLVHGLARETGAALFNLSPINMIGKYLGKKEEDYLLNLLLKVTKSMEPVILLVDECHLLFPTKKSRKRPDVDFDKPARLAKLLSKLMKKIKPGDRTLLIGVTSEPFFAKQGAMFKLFPNVLWVPFPNYGTREALWRTFIGKESLKSEHKVNFSIMAGLTKGYTGADIKRSIQHACPPDRKEKKPKLTNKEFLAALIKRYPDDDTPTNEEWLTWFLSTPMSKARQALLQSIVDEEIAAAEAKSKKK